MKKIMVSAPAKLNLALDITGVLDNGYHTVDMIMQTVGLFERVEITKSRGYSLRCPGSPVPANDKNTATKAAAAFFYETGLLAGCDITVHKATPTRAGMGGGSSDAAAVLFGLNELYGARLTLAQLCEIGATIGADVPFALMGGTARVTGIGEILQPLPPLPACWFTIAMPSGGVSTPAAYARYDEMGSPVRPDMNAAEQAIRAGSLQALVPHMQNALEYSNGGRHTEKIRRLLEQKGALASMMTGSGAAVFGVFATQPQAKAAADALRHMVPQVFVVPPAPHGPQIVQKS